MNSFLRHPWLVPIVEDNTPGQSEVNLSFAKTPYADGLFLQSFPLYFHNWISGEFFSILLPRIQRRTGGCNTLFVS
jgi:hypothetical protein